jgi:hypothetical protein
MFSKKFGRNKIQEKITKRFGTSENQVDGKNLDQVFLSNS